MNLLLLLLACGNGSKGEASLTEGPGTDDPVFTIEEAELALVNPASGGFVDPGDALVTGVAKAMAEVAVSGIDASVSGGTFSVEVPMELGVNVLDVNGIDVEGGAWRDVGMVLAGDFAAADGPVLDAVQVHLGANALAELGPVVGQIITPDLLNPTLLALNPIVDSPEAVVNLGELRFGTPTIELIPSPNGLLMGLTLPDFVLPIHATIPDALPFGIDLDLDPDLEADAITLYAKVDLDVDGNGHLVIDLTNVSAELQGFDLDTGILELVDWLVIDDDDIAALIENQVAALGPGLGVALTDMVKGIDLKTELDLLGLPLTVWPAFASASTDATGVGLGLAIAIDVAGPVPDAPGHLHFPSPPPLKGQDLTLQVADDFMNRALFELWAAGALDIELPLEDAASLAILAVFGGSGSGSLSLQAGLPPVWLERNGQTRLQLGDALLTVETPGGLYGEKVEMKMLLDAAADITVTADAAGVVLSDPLVTMVLIGESAESQELQDNLPTIQGAFGLGLGMINGLLSFPLDGLLGPDMTLPAIDLRRDPSGLGLTTDMSMADLDLVTLVLGPQPPSVVAIPATATVLPDDDDGRTSDGEQGWVCDNSQIESTGQKGTWFVDDGGELVLFGGANTVYAVDGAEVTLEAPGNTIYAAPGATVRDNDGTNTVIVADPLSFDLAAAPVPGC